MCDPYKSYFLAHAGIAVGIVVMLLILSATIVCIVVAVIASRSRRNRHPVAYRVVDTDDTNSSITSSFSTSVVAGDSASSYQPVNQLPLSATPASYTTQHHIPQPTSAPVTAVNNEATTEPPPPYTGPLVSSFDLTQTVVGDTPAVDSQPATSSDIV